MARLTWIRLLALTLGLAACMPAAMDFPSNGNRATDSVAQRLSDPTAYSFVVVGCNRVASKDLGKTHPSTANVEQLQRTFAEVAKLDLPPAYLFFVGDLVHGLTTDLGVLERQLRAWRDLYEHSALAGSGVRLVAVPGNHELLKVRLLPPGETSNDGADQVWLRVMQPYIVGSNGPKAGGPDKLKVDESRLTYSVDFRDSHFVVLNTDPMGAPSTVPVNWLASDLAAARSRPEVRHIFALGHKPAYSPPRSTEDVGLSEVPQVRDRFWKLLDQYGAEAMLAAHNHRYYRSQPAGLRPWQIVAGNGGSELEPQLPPAERFFGFTVVRVRQSGSVQVESYGRDEPAAGYLAPAAAYPTTVRDSFTIARP